MVHREPKLSDDRIYFLAIVQKAHEEIQVQVDARLLASRTLYVLN